tara:strand:+ start:1516 stop:2016 length:501 start_codon:yes stop_codon:yes gene_type:complete
MNAEDLIKHFGLVPLPKEGGFYLETYRSPAQIPGTILPYQDSKSFSTAIYYCLTKNTFSHLHRLPTDEIYHFYYGDPVELFFLIETPTPRFEVHLLGSDFMSGHLPQIKVPANSWQGSRLVDDGEVALMGTTMSPGFDFKDLELADYENLKRLLPRADYWLKLLCT